MLRNTLVGVLLAMMMGALPICAQTDAEKEEPKVNMTADDLSAAEVAAEIEEQTGVQVAVTEWTEGVINGTLSDFTVEDAVKSLGQAAGASWVRFYLLETAPPEEPYTASELMIKLDEARRAWIEGLTDEQRQDLFGGMRGQRPEDGQGPRGGPADQGAPAAEAAEGAAAAEDEGADQPEAAAQAEGQGDQGDRRERGDRGRDFRTMFEGPGGAIAPTPRPEPQEGEEGERRRWGGRDNYVDPLRNLLLPGRTDTITLEMTDAPLGEALTEFMLKSHFIVIIDDGLTGAVSVQLEEAPLSEALDAIAEGSGAQWRTAYLVSAPRQLTQEEIAQRETDREQRREERFNQRWGEFWAQPAQERAAEIQERVQRMEQMAERMERFRAQNPERAARWQGRMGRFGDRMLTRMMDYSSQLTPEQRLEIKPLLEAMANMQRNR